MTKFVFLGSRRFAPYEIPFVPIEMRDILDEEERYQISIKRSHPAMDKADVVIVYAPDGIGKHTQLDIDYALENNKEVFKLVPLKAKKETVLIWVPEWYDKTKNLFKRFRDLGFDVYVANDYDEKEPILWYRDEVYVGEDRIDSFEKKWRKKEKNNG
jgi:soluble P-type ATPase